MAVRFESDARFIIDDAVAMAKRFGHDRVEARHFMLSLVNWQENSATQALVCFDGLRFRKQFEQMVSTDRGTLVSRHAEFTAEARDILDGCEDAKRALGDPRVGVGHILLAIVRHGDNEVARFLADHGIGVQAVRQTLILIRFGAEPTQIREAMVRDAEGVVFVPSQTMRELHGMCLSASQACHHGALAGTTSTDVRGREVRRILQVLSRRTLNNAVLVGDPGVGKTTVLDDLSRMFAAGRVTRTLDTKELFRVRWSGLHHEAARYANNPS